MDDASIMREASGMHPRHFTSSQRMMSRNDAAAPPTLPPCLHCSEFEELLQDYRLSSSPRERTDKWRRQATDGLTSGGGRPRHIPLMAASVEEQRLQSELEAASEGSGEYMQLLNDLASLKLSQGNISGAEELYAKLRSLRLPSLVAAAEQASSEVPSTRTSNSFQAVSHINGLPESQPNKHDASANDDDDEDDWETKDFSAPVAAKPPVAEKSNGTQLQQQHKDSAKASASWGPDPDGQSSSHGGRHSRSQTGSSIGAGGGLTDPSKTSSDANTADDYPSQGAVTWEGGFDHCVEVYNLTPAIKTTHLQRLLDQVLPDAKLSPFIRWADDNHAVFVCGSISDAECLLADDQDKYSLRPFSEASQASKQLPIAELLPPKPRPKTTATVAKKLLSHALGMPQLRDRHGEKQLAVARKEAKQERSARREGVTDAWGDD